jgi:hypothetical protein
LHQLLSNEGVTTWGISRRQKYRPETAAPRPVSHVINLAGADHDDAAAFKPPMTPGLPQRFGMQRSGGVDTLRRVGGGGHGGPLPDCCYRLLYAVIASEAKQSMDVAEGEMDCFVASLLAMTERVTASTRNQRLKLQGIFLTDSGYLQIRIVHDSQIFDVGY